MLNFWKSQDWKSFQIYLQEMQDLILICHYSKAVVINLSRFINQFRGCHCSHHAEQIQILISYTIRGLRRFNKPAARSYSISTIFIKILREIINHNTPDIDVILFRIQNALTSHKRWICISNGSISVYGAKFGSFVNASIDLS